MQVMILRSGEVLLSHHVYSMTLTRSQVSVEHLAIYDHRGRSGAVLEYVLIVKASHFVAHETSV